MAKKDKKNLGLENREVPVETVYSNEFGIGYSDNEVVLNFSFSTPSYLEPHNDVEVPVARVILPWKATEVLMETLKDICDEHKKSAKPKRKTKVKSK